MARLLIHRYALPLRRPWHTARGVLTRRQGFIVVLEQAGDLGIGECAPLPMAGTESLRQAQERLRHWQDRLQSAGWSSDRLLAALADGWPAQHQRRMLPLRPPRSTSPREVRGCRCADC